MITNDQVKQTQIKRFINAGWSAKEAEKVWKLYKREYLAARKEYKILHYFEEYSLIK